MTTGSAPARRLSLAAGAAGLIGLLAAAVPFGLAIVCLTLVGNVRAAGTDVLLPLAAGVTAAASGGRMHAAVTGTGDLDGFTGTPPGDPHLGSLTVSLLPLTLSAVGLAVLAVGCRAAVRRWGLGPVAAAGASALGVAAYAGALSLLALRSTHDFRQQGSSFAVHIGAWGTAAGAAGSGLAVVGLTLAASHRPRPQPLARLIGRLKAPLHGYAVVAVAATAGSLVVGLATAARSGDSAGFTAAAVLLGLPNVLGYLLLLGTGVSIDGAGQHIGFEQLVDPPATVAVQPHGALTIGSFALEQPLWWAVPVLLGVLLVAGAMVAALRAARPVAALTRYALGLPLLLAACCALLRIATVVVTSGEPTQNGRLATTVAPSYAEAIGLGLASGVGAAALGWLLVRLLPSRATDRLLRLARALP